MAKQIVTLLTDDLDGGEADKTVEFAVDGIGYSIDLSERNADEFMTIMRRYINAGTRLGRVSTNGYSPGGTVRKNGTDHPNFLANRALNTKIREWAERNGYHIAERGRIPQHVVNAYHRGTPASPVSQDQMDVVAASPNLLDVIAAPEPEAVVEDKPKPRTRRAPAARKAAPRKAAAKA